MIVGIALVIIGLVALAVQTGVIQGSVWGWVWPLLLILVGLTFLMRRHRSGGWCCGPWRDKEDDHKM